MFNPLLQAPLPLLLLFTIARASVASSCSGGASCCSRSSGGAARAFMGTSPYRSGRGRRVGEDPGEGRFDSDDSSDDDYATSRAKRGWPRVPRCSAGCRWRQCARLSTWVNHRHVCQLSGPLPRQRHSPTSAAVTRTPARRAPFRHPGRLAQTEEDPDCREGQRHLRQGLRRHGATRAHQCPAARDIAAPRRPRSSSRTSRDPLSRLTLIVSRSMVRWLAADASHSIGQLCRDAATRFDPRRARGGVRPFQNGHATHEDVQAAGGQDMLDEFDLTKSASARCLAAHLLTFLDIRVRSVFDYEGLRDVDLSFAENVVIDATPTKDASSPWWYGTLVKEGARMVPQGLCPGAVRWVSRGPQRPAILLIQCSNKGEGAVHIRRWRGRTAAVREGDVITMCDTSDSDWWED